jgi:hypothetical protein
MKFLFEDLRMPKSKPVLEAIKRLIDAGVALETIAEGFGDTPECNNKIIAISAASGLIKIKAISFSRLGIIYDSSAQMFDIFYKEMQEIYDKSPERYQLLTRNNWEFLTHFISENKTPKEFEALYLQHPNKFKRMREMFI